MYESPFLQTIETARAAARASGLHRLAEMLDDALLIAQSERCEALRVALADGDGPARERALDVLAL